MSKTESESKNEEKFTEAKYQKEYTTDEIAKHNKEGDLWMVIGGRVCDVSNFDDHPGGPDVLEGIGGMDATDDFEQIAHSNAAKKQVEDFVIGKKEGEKIVDLLSDMDDHPIDSSLIFTALALILAVAAYYYFNTEEVAQ